MVTYQPICLEVNCISVIYVSQNIYRCILTADGGQETAYYNSNTIESDSTYSIKIYTCADIQVGMYFNVFL